MIFKIEQDTLIKWKTLYNKSCRSCFIEFRTVEFVFFLFFYDFISILQVRCLMRPGRQDLNVIFFTFRSCRPASGRQAPCRPGRGRQGSSLWNFSKRPYIFEILIFFKYKNEKDPKPATSSAAHQRPRWPAIEWWWPMRRWSVWI